MGATNSDVQSMSPSKRGMIGKWDLGKGYICPRNGLIGEYIVTVDFSVDT